MGSQRYNTQRNQGDLKMVVWALQ